jgi:hypothetical protein
MVTGGRSIVAFSTRNIGLKMSFPFVLSSSARHINFSMGF